MKILCVVDHGNAPSTLLRLRDCLDYYSALGVEATVVPTRRSSVTERLRVLKEARQHDVVVLFKTIGFNEIELGLLQNANRRIVFDFDDAVMFRDQKHRRPLRGKDFKKFLRTVRHCAAVVAGNDFLACFAEASGRRAVILPTSIDLRRYHLKRDFDGPGLTIGWVGLSDGLPYLRHIQPALERLSEMFPGLKLKVVSDKPLQLDRVQVENDPWQLETEQTNLASFDIGIMPLWDSVWTRGKCGYKILQYMGVGTAVVASDVGVNHEIISHGENGFLARTQDDWVDALASLIKNAEQRRTFGLRGRELIEKRYSLENFAQGYVKLLHEVARIPGESADLRGRRSFGRWNLSSRARELSGGDAVVISVPKSGRTWVRTFLCAYFCKRTGRPFTLRPDRYHEPNIPRMIFSHDFAEQRMKATLWERVRGKYLVPARELARAPVILLVRDPRDAFVSLYMQLVHRTRETPQELKQKSIGDLLRDRRYGILSIIKTMNNWFAEFGHRKNFTLLHYESLRAAPEENFRNLLSTLGETLPDPEAFKYAVEFSDFANMQRLEVAGHNPQPYLTWSESAEGKQDSVSYLRSNVRRNFARIFGYRFNPKGLWLRAGLSFGKHWGWKEPRTTLFVPVWLEIFPEARIVHVIRDAHAAASSIRERELKFQAAGNPPTPNLADLDYCRQLVQTYLTAGERLADSANYRRIQFEELQANPLAMLERLANFCGLRATTRQLAAAAASIRPARVRSTS